MAWRTQNYPRAVSPATVFNCWIVMNLQLIVWRSLSFHIPNTYNFFTAVLTEVHSVAGCLVFI